MISLLRRRMALGALVFAWIASVATAVDRPAVFVNISTSQVASGATPTEATVTSIAAPGGGWNYSAAAPLAGTGWNNILRPNPAIGSNSTSVIGEYICNSADEIALKSPTGDATGVRLSLWLDIKDLEANTTRTEPNTGGGGNTVLGPNGMMNQSWRIYRGGNGTIHRLSGLPAGAHYHLYVYGSTATAGQGCRFTADVANVPDGGPAFIETRGGNFGNVFGEEGADYALTVPAQPGVASVSTDATTWGRLHVVVDGAGRLTFRTAKNAANSQYFNGYQLVPFPVPVITTQPPAQAIGTLGGNVSLTVAANGEGVLVYQWRKSGIALVDGPSGTGSIHVGAATQTLAINGLSAADAGEYDVVVSNLGGVSASTLSTVVVSNEAVAPSIVAEPAPAMAASGAPVLLTVSANGSAPLSYRWQRSMDNVAFADIPAANGAAYSLAGATTADAGYYRVVVANSVGAVTSVSVSLVIAPVLVAPPVAAIVGAGDSAALTAGVDAGAGAPVATTYVWRRNGTVVTDGGVFSGASTSSLAVASMGSAQSGYYTLTASNPAGSSTSAPVYFGLATTVVTTLTPAPGALAVNVDAPLVVRFASPPRVGSAGRIVVRRATDDAEVETIDLAALPFAMSVGESYRYKTRQIGDGTYNYLPVVVVGDELRITLQAKLARGVTYYLTAEPGALLDGSGLSLPAITGPAVWAFTTKLEAPDAVPARTTFTVAADGAGDFATLQGALDHIPTGNTTPVRIELLAGVYDGIVNSGSRHNLTLVGQGHERTIVQAFNNDLFNAGTAGRPAVTLKGNDLLVRDLAIVNTTRKGGAQAEALRSDGQRVVYLACAFRSFQDTLLLGGTSYFQDCLIAGDTDYIWGGGTAMFKRCELLCLSPAELTQNRAPATRFGFVFVECAITKPVGASFSYGLGRNSNDSNVAFIDTRMDTHISTAGWSNGFGTVLRNWEFNSRNLAGTAPINVAARVHGRQLTEAEAIILRAPANVYGLTLDGTPAGALGDGWIPSVPAVALPEIVTHPQSRNVAAGQTVSFSVMVTGAPYLTYQWRKGGDPLAGQIFATLTLATAGYDAAGVYDCVVTGSGGVVTSQPATLGILSPVAAWADAFGLDGTIAGFAAGDADGDGLANLLEYVFGSDPSSAESSLRPAIITGEDESGKYMVLEYRRAVAASSVPVLVETSMDLSTWHTRTLGADMEVVHIPSLGLAINVDVNTGATSHNGPAAAPGNGPHWNGISTTTTSLADLWAADGAATPVDLLVTSSGGFSAWSNATNGSPNPVLLMQDYYFGNTYAVTLSALPAGSYRLYVYAHGDQDSQTSIITLAPANGGGTTGTVQAGASGAFRDVFATGAEGVAYVKFDAVVGETGTLQFSSGNYLNGFQLVQLSDPAHETIRVTLPYTGERIFVRLRALLE